MSEKINNEVIIRNTKEWIERIVIGLNFCPFAKRPFENDQILYKVTFAKDTNQLLKDLIIVLQNFIKIDPKVTETAFLIHPDVLNDFLDFNDFLEIADAAVVELGLEQNLQIASFHPQYQFAGTKANDIENSTNRSPYPMLHLLREASLTKAIDGYPDVNKIPERNIALLKSMDQKTLKKLKLI